MPPDRSPYAIICPYGDDFSESQQTRKSPLTYLKRASLPFWSNKVFATCEKFSE